MQTEIDDAALRAAQDVTLRRGFARHFADGSTGCAPGTFSVAADSYTDPLRWEAERRGIFGRLPLLACLTQDVPDPGDVLLFDETGIPIIIVRGRDRQVRAFRNMCMHRAAKLVEDCRRGARNISCPYHGWTYDLDGALVGVPRRDDFDERELAGRNLMRVPVGEWGGMVFVKTCLGDEHIDVAAFLGEQAEPLRQLELHRAGPAARGRIEIACNWKYAYDTYTEGYHIGYLHAQTVGAMYVGGVNVVSHRGLHHEMAFGSHQLKAALGSDAVPDAPELAGNVSRILHVFPNVAINHFPVSPTEQLVNIHRVYPGRTVHECVSVQTSYKCGGAVTADDHAIYQQNHDLIMHVTGNEDFRVCGQSYANLLNAPAGFRLVFGRNEPIVQAMHRNHAEAAGLPLDAREHT